MRVLVVEDNQRLARLTCDGLGAAGFAADAAGDLQAADAALAAASFDALVLDLGLPDGDGLAWLRERRQARSVPPALVLTARGALEDRVAGLDAGADDYLVKPFEVAEVAARLRALLRRPGVRSDVELVIGPISFDTNRREAKAHGERLELARREADLLELLMRRAGSVVRRQTIEDSLYSFDAAVTPNAVEATVSRLRRKLEQAGCGDMLHTVRGVGYMLEERT
ncbi:response regulator transcription factor [Stakelama sediminis]|uniref:Two-component system response regulator QseB n=1 Tax=Stakelama sediminis TaxID=463200 RepID=A0A840Z1C3_9SPHN|nr:response regulator transcription factor [Stakelama sediminis]MBB5719725.1 two-component system response regulator QseB [Stakelama sediminis]